MALNQGRSMKWADRSLAVALMAIAVGWIYLASRLPFPLFAQISNIAPGHYPMAVAALLGLLGTILFAQTIFSPDNQGHHPLVPPAGKSKAAQHFLPGFALFLAYVMVLPWIGFTVSSFLFVFCFVRWKGRYGILAAGALAIGIPALLWSIFTYLLAVPLPQGSWGL